MTHNEQIQHPEYENQDKELTDHTQICDNNLTSKTAETPPNDANDAIPADAVHELEEENIILHKAKPDIYEYVTAINLEISNRINNVKSVFQNG